MQYLALVVVACHLHLFFWKIYRSLLNREFHQENSP